MADLFDPEESLAPAAIAAGPKPVTLSAFLQEIGAVIKSRFGTPRWVQVEVSKINNRSNHAYFDFVEYGEDGRETAKARGSLWASRKMALFNKFQKATGTQIQDGMKLLLLLRPDFNPQYGFSFSIEDVDPAYTLGDMQAKLKAIREALVEAGIYEANRRIPAPREFCRVAVVSPEGAAGLADFMRESEALKSHGLCHFDYFTALFQGKDAPASIRRALRQVRDLHDEQPYDAVVIIRGGGASADLAWLNDFELARDVCLMPLPVYTGIGHQIDDTILDEVSFRRLDTPSKVSAYIVATIIENAESALQAMLNILKDTGNALVMAETKLDSMIVSIQAASLQAATKAEHEIQVLMNRIRDGAMNGIDMTEQRLQAMMSEIMGLSPRNTLARGYAIIRDPDGKPVTSAAAAKPGMKINIEMRDGLVPARVEG